MDKVITWSISDDEKINLTILINGQDVIVEMPTSIYNEIVSSGPPTADKKIRDLIEQIHQIRKDRNLYVEKIAEQDDQLLKDADAVTKENKNARDNLKDAHDKHEISKWKGVMDSCNTDLQIITKKKSILQEYRHLIKLTHQEEGKLRSELMRKLRS